MTIVYTPQHLAAALEMRDACTVLGEAIANAPDPGVYRAAWDRHVLATSMWAGMWPAGHVPHTLDVIASAHQHPNMLRLALAEHVYATADGRFVVSPYLPGPKSGKWAVEYRPHGSDEDSAYLIDVDGDNDVDGVANAQLVIDLIDWAYTDGARDGQE